VLLQRRRGAFAVLVPGEHRRHRTAGPRYNNRVATLPRNPVSSRWIAPAFVLGALVLVPWTLVLAFRLPARHTSHHWDVAWVGFDLALAAALACTGLAVARRSVWAPTAAAVAATLLLCDAWFDNVLANGMHEHLEAALEAAFVELPLAIFCVWLGLHSEHAVEAVLDAVRRPSPTGRRRRPTPTPRPERDSRRS